MFQGEIWCLKNKRGFAESFGQFWEERVLWRRSRRARTNQKRIRQTMDKEGQYCKVRIQENTLSPRRQTFLEPFRLHVHRLSDDYSSPRRRMKFNLCHLGDKSASPRRSTCYLCHRLGEGFPLPRRQLTIFVVASATVYYIRETVQWTVAAGFEGTIK